MCESGTNDEKRVNCFVTVFQERLKGVVVRWGLLPVALCVTSNTPGRLPQPGAVHLLAVTSWHLHVSAVGHSSQFLLACEVLLFFCIIMGIWAKPSRDGVSEGQDNVRSLVFSNWPAQYVERLAPSNFRAFRLPCGEKYPKEKPFPLMWSGPSELPGFQVSRLLNTWQGVHRVESGWDLLEISSSTNQGHGLQWRSLTLTENSRRWSDPRLDKLTVGVRLVHKWRPGITFPHLHFSPQQQTAYFMPLS